MSLTQIAVVYGSGLFGPDNEPAEGTISLQLAGESVSSGVTVVASPVTLRVWNGVLSGSLWTNGQGGLQATVTENLAGAVNPAPYVVTVPVSGTLDLSTAARSTAPATPVPTYVLASTVGQPGGIATLDSNGLIPAALLSSPRLPSENYLVGWTAPPELMQSSNPPTAGEVYLQRVVVPAATLTKVYAFIYSAGSGMTAGENLVGLYDANGNLLCQSADTSAVWTGTHVAEIAVPSTAVAAGPIYVAALFNGSVMPQLAAGAQQYWDLPSIGPGIANWASPTPPYASAPNHWRFMSYGSGRTSLFSSIPLGSANPDKAFWFGVA